MAKDDYEVVACKILVYLYACFKGKVVFNRKVFEEAISADSFPEGYLARVLRMMQKDGLVDGVQFTKAWGNVYIIISDLSGMEITSKGIDYLKNNSTMQKVLEFIKEGADLIASLIPLVIQAP